jgi:hypothetical protein
MAPVPVGRRSRVERARDHPHDRFPTSYRGGLLPRPVKRCRWPLGSDDSAAEAPASRGPLNPLTPVAIVR